MRPLLAAVLAAVLAAGPGAALSAAQTTTTTTAQGAATQPAVTAEQAGNGILLEAADRVELAQDLADATEESGVCFGYVVREGVTVEQLSNAGPGVAPDPAGCTKGRVELHVDLVYTSPTSEAEDSASFRVVADVPGLTSAAATQRLRDLSGVSEDDLLGGDDDVALRNATAALPLLLPDATPAELPATTATTAPNGDRLTGSPSSDWIREHGLGIGVAGGLLVLGLVLFVAGIAGRRRSRPSAPSGRSGRRSSGTPSPTTTHRPRP